MLAKVIMSKYDYPVLLVNETETGVLLRVPDPLDDREPALQRCWEVHQEIDFDTLLANLSEVGAIEDVSEGQEEWYVDREDRFKQEMEGLGFTLDRFPDLDFDDII